MSGNGRINGLVQAAGVHPAVHRHPDHLDRLKRTRRRPPLTSGCRVRSQPDFARGVDHLGPQTAAIGVRREKAALSSGCKAHRPCIEFLDPHSSERSSPLTRRRRETDSNHRSLIEESSVGPYDSNGLEQPVELGIVQVFERSREVVW